MLPGTNTATFVPECKICSMNKLIHILLPVVLLSLPSLLSAQAPSLGTAADFVLFSSNGAVTNSGISLLTGNIGSNNGAVTGFGNVNGVMHSGDGATLTCAGDLLTAYTLLDNAIPTFFPAPLLGNGDTLEAGVYSITANTSLNLNLYLDALGDPNAVFIFQIEAPFSTNPASEIKLINGAQACNVFWKVEGLVSMAAGTKMRGNVIANNAAIDINTGAELEGRALSTAGAVSVSGVFGYTPVGCGSPIHLGPAAPPLGTAGCFALFSANGGVSNSGITNVVGDVGTNSGLTTGFDPLTVTGTIHPIPDIATGVAAADLLTVYNYLNILPYDIELLYPAQFGNNLVLTPHTYLMSGATTFTDTVFLDGEGDPNAVFVIQANGAFTSGTYAQVVLRNGTQASNVYWKVEGAVTLNGYTNFVGTIICNAGAIIMATGATLDGRALTTDGALSVSAIVTSMTPTNCLPLSLNWLYFAGDPSGATVDLKWATTDNQKNSFFTLEKSSNGKSFEDVAKIDASVGRTEYSYKDYQPNTNGYYRISQTNVSGQRTYYTTIRVIMSKSSNVSHYVQGDNVYVLTTGMSEGEGSIQLYSIDGRKVASRNIMLSNDVNTYKIEKPSQSGMYLIYMESRGEKIYTGKIIVE
jgi:hypothetical protein